MAQIIKKPQALEDAAEIWAYIAIENSPQTADSFTGKIDLKLYMLASNPRSGSLRNELYPNLRSAHVGRYLIFYFALDDGIEVVRIIYGGRDLNAVFSDFDPEE